MSIFRKLSVRRRSESATGSCSKPSKETTTSEESEPSTPKRRHSRRAHSLGSLFSRHRSKGSVFESYETDFWDRNFQNRSTIPWNEFQAALILDYKQGIEEFAATGHLREVLSETCEEICNKDSIAYIMKYRKYIGKDAGPDALWIKVKQNTVRRVFEDGIIDSLCL